MSKFIVTSRHQVEINGKMYTPGQFVPGFNPKRDGHLLEAGLLTEVEGAAKAAPKTTKSGGTTDDDKEKKA